MANFNLDKLVNEFNKAETEEKEQAIETLQDVLAVEYFEREKKLKLELEILSAKMDRMTKSKSA